MKRYLAFTVILLGNLLRGFSCGYSPYGEDIRYSLFSPEYFNYGDFKAFHYNADEFGLAYDTLYHEDVDFLNYCQQIEDKYKTKF